MARIALGFAVLLCLATPGRGDTIEVVFQPPTNAPPFGHFQPFGAVETPSGAIVFVDMTGHQVISLTRKGAEGWVKALAGTGREGFAGDGGPATAAEFKGCHALSVMKNGDLLIADTWNNRVRKIDAKTGMIRTIAGSGEKGFAGDGGPATAARFGGIYSIALSADEGTMFLADLDNRRIRAVDLGSGIVRTVAGNGKKGVPEDGAKATDAPLVDPRAVAVDRDGRVYLVERNGHTLRVVEPDGTIRTVAGTGKAGLSGDGGPALRATLNGPKDVAIDRDGGVLIADTENHCIRKFWPKDGTITRVAGSGSKGSKGANGPAEAVEMVRPHGVFVERSGSILISDSENGRVLRVVRDR